MMGSQDFNDEGDSGQSPCKKRPRNKPLFDNFFSSQKPIFSLSERVWNPPADVYETCQNTVVIKMEIAGVNLENLQITAENNYLVVRGCRSEESLEPKPNYHLMEIRYGAFERAFGLPFKLEADLVRAQCTDGFLVITVTRKPREVYEVPVRAAGEIDGE